MLRRLFFLFPNEAKAKVAVDQLLYLNISERHIHAIAHGVKLTTLPEATKRQKNDTAFRVERSLWYANLQVFVIALLMLGASVFLSNVILAVLSVVLMMVTFLAAELFVVKVPDVHLTEFTDALSHGEVLLMVDVYSGRVAEIENFVHHKHPEATIGGVGWTVDAFGL